MKPELREKMNEILRMSDEAIVAGKLPAYVTPSPPDALSEAIRTQKDADDFMAQLRAITANRD
ncbi:hypothetical protein [uncultured Chitinophaga sp.]|uniref:hypothetical protein n=1 Tax=uncultured Chitinophaga sp. TaxID=339340 RepID=UPI0025F1025E|nr:hypothetical protein [uncultured Chitinophaga sp.]